MALALQVQLKSLRCGHATEHLDIFLQPLALLHEC